MIATKRPTPECIKGKRQDGVGGNVLLNCMYHSAVLTSLQRRSWNVGTLPFFAYSATINTTVMSERPRRWLYSMIVVSTKLSESQKAGLTGI